MGDSDKSYPFEYIWEQSQGPNQITPSKPIPGHSKSRSGSGKSSGGKSPRNSIPKSPSASSLSKSPKNNELQKLKESIITPLEDSVEEQNDTTKKSSVVTFEED